MIKARAVYGEPHSIDELKAILRPFTYRKYIDFSAIQALRDMKTLINREVARLGILDDVKKSAGGIREIEFVAQAFQLIRGGKDKRFQNPSLRNILQVLAEDKLLPEGEPENLWRAYEFLRNAEHILQGMADKQTQRLPDDEVGRAAVAYLMGFGSWDSFYEALDDHRNRVKELFQGVAAPPLRNRQIRQAPLSYRLCGGRLPMPGVLLRGLKKWDLPMLIPWHPD
jgi:Glutamine synthetase adenylyltransferase